MPNWYDTQTQTVTFTSPTVRAAWNDFKGDVANGLIGNLVGAIGYGISQGSVEAGIGKFAQTALWTAGKSAIVNTVFVSEEFRQHGSDFEVNVNRVWTGPHPLAMVTPSSRDLPGVWKNASFQMNDDGDSITTFADGKKVIFRADNCGLDMWGNGEAELLEACSGSDNYLHGGGGNDIIKGNGGRDYLRGGTGSDRVLGGSGNDTIVGNKGDAGTDYWYGGSGADTFRFDGDRNVTIKDFKREDRVTGFDTDDMVVYRYTDDDSLASVKVSWENNSIWFVEDGGADGVWPASRAQIVDWLQ